MFTAIIIDGVHKGYVSRNPYPRREISIPVHSPISASRLCDTDDSAPVTVAVNCKRYVLTFLSEDREWGLFSEKGDPSVILNSGDWLVQKDTGWRPRQPLIFFDLPPDECVKLSTELRRLRQYLSELQSGVRRDYAGVAYFTSIIEDMLAGRGK